MLAVDMYEVFRSHFPHWDPWDRIPQNYRQLFNSVANSISGKIVNEVARNSTGSADYYERRIADLQNQLAAERQRVAPTAARFAESQSQLGETLRRLETYKGNRKKENDQFDKQIADLKFERDRLLRRLGMTEPEPVKNIPINRMGETESMWVLRKTSSFAPLLPHEIYRLDSDAEMEPHSLATDGCRFMIRHASFSEIPDPQTTGLNFLNIIAERGRLKRIREAS